MARVCVGKSVNSLVAFPPVGRTLLGTSETSVADLFSKLIACDRYKTDVYERKRKLGKD